MLDIFDYKSSKIDEETTDLQILFDDCVIKKDLDCYPVGISRGDKIELISVNLDSGVMQFYRRDNDTVLKYAELEISTQVNLLEFT